MALPQRSVELHLDLSDLAAELAAMAELLEAVEEERDLSQFPEAERPPISKPPPES
jgi:cytoskeletal protein RodZ